MGGNCLANAPLTGAHWRIAVPMLIFGCVCLYIHSNTGKAAVMTVFLTSAEHPNVDVYSLMTLGVVKSVSDLWNANLKALAMLIFLFSVVFPYVKLSLCL